jgi:hypothetical protein
VGVPVVNRLFKAPPSDFGIHCLMVVAAAMVLWGGGLLVKVFVARYIGTGMR